MITLEKECLLLNSSWVAIGIKSVQSAISMLASGAARGMDFSEDGNFIPTTWEDWLKLPIREIDDVIHTTKLTVRVPRVIISAKYNRVPVKRRRLSVRSLSQHYKDRCAYTGAILSKSNRSVDHVLPKAKGGKTEWSNVVLCDRKLNSLKADRTPQEAGLKLLVTPGEPKRVPFHEIARSNLAFEEWKFFIKGEKL